MAFVRDQMHSTACRPNCDAPAPAGQPLPVAPRFTGDCNIDSSGADFTRQAAAAPASRHT
jgi:hypothetical protein